MCGCKTVLLFFLSPRISVQAMDAQPWFGGENVCIKRARETEGGERM